MMEKMVQKHDEGRHQVFPEAAVEEEGLVDLRNEVWHRFEMATTRH
jgi:hypothetical protein